MFAGQWKEVSDPLMFECAGKYDLIMKLAEVSEAGKVELDWFRFA